MALDSMLLTICTTAVTFTQRRTKFVSYWLVVHKLPMLNHLNIPLGLVKDHGLSLKKSHLTVGRRHDMRSVQ